jgi:hypothetical protein
MVARKRKRTNKERRMARATIWRGRRHGGGKDYGSEGGDDTETTATVMRRRRL